MDGELRRKAKQVLAKLGEHVDDGGCRIDWTYQEKEVWCQINALDLDDRLDLHLEVIWDLRNETSRFLAIMDKMFGPDEGGFEAFVQTLSEAERREMGETPEEKVRWLKKRLLDM